MGSILLKTVFSLLTMLVLALSVIARPSEAEQSTEVVMRMIGHQMLLQAEDSVSRVLPVKKDGGRYIISFASEFEIDPERMSSVIDSVIAATEISKAYIVEVITCKTDEVVFSYEIGRAEDTDVIPCKSRELPVDCYSVLVTLKDFSDATENNEEFAAQPGGPVKSNAALLLLPLLLALGLIVYLLRNRRKSTKSPHVIAIGEYLFDPKAMTLSYQSECIELTGKESELLYLLHSSANSTVVRELILEKVWGDQGDYIGRTLDVFVSKLRKKLQADSHVQIKNVRGVGYKLIVTAA